jgi:hypothetical protein
MIVTSKQCTEYETHRFSAEASELGLPPGFWPHELETDMGNKQPFVAIRRLEDGGVVYAQRFGCIELKVFND